MSDEVNAASPALDELADRMGIELEFRDARGQMSRASQKTKRELLAAMGVEAADEAAAIAALEMLDRAEWQRPLPPVLVLRSQDAFSVDVTLPTATRDIAWHLHQEDGREQSGKIEFAQLALLAECSLDGHALQRRQLQLAFTPPCGYHKLTLMPGDATTSLVVTPGRCWLPPALTEGQRLWGIAAQLYLVRSASDWGIGDFGDLRRLVELASDHGAGVIGLNPLHAMFTDNPDQASPYSPASRLLLNVLNIDVPAASALMDCEQARGLRGSKAFRAQVEACRAASMVDYAGVASLKLSALEALFSTWLKARDKACMDAFEAFRCERGAALQRHCLFLALRQHFAGQDPGGADWHTWPEDYRDPNSPAVAEFATRNRQHVDFLVWMQWVADTQLGGVAALAAERGMTVGIYRDLAVGADRAGAETWANAAAVVSGAQVGAPPDIHNPAGQNWGLPPFHPRALREEGYASFIELVRSNMRHAGGLRIDHVMALQQLYWVPRGEDATAGAYVRYPLDDLVGILSLESQRQRCLVVGEDLGTVPEGFRERMTAANILSYRVLFFEQEGETGDFLPPDAYPSLALAVVGSHDLPTLRGWWEARDIDLKERLGLYPGSGEAVRQRETRRRDRTRLIEALSRENLLPVGEEPAIQALAHAVHAYIARSPSALALAQIDDLTDEADQVNVPSTAEEHPNWRRRLSMTLEDLRASSRLIDIAEIFRAERGGSLPSEEAIRHV